MSKPRPQVKIQSKLNKIYDVDKSKISVKIIRESENKISQGKEE